MTREMATERNGIPPAVVTAAADVPETVLGPAAPAAIPPAIDVPDGVPVLADRGYDSDPLREQLAADGFDLVCRHRSNRTRPATADGRKLRRRTRRYEAERTFAWVYAFRRVVTRFEKTAELYDGFVGMAVALVCLGKLIPEVTDSCPHGLRNSLYTDSRNPAYSPSIAAAGQRATRCDVGRKILLGHWKSKHFGRPTPKLFEAGLRSRGGKPCDCTHPTFSTFWTAARATSRMSGCASSAALTKAGTAFAAFGPMAPSA